MACLAFAAGIGAAAVLQVNIEPVLTGSMRPGIQPGDLAVLRPVPADALRRGQVVAYLPPRYTTPVLHRIVSVTGGGVITRGDANRVDDPWGRVRPAGPTVESLVAVVPKVGFLLELRRPLIVIAGIVLLAAAAVFLWPAAHGERPGRRRIRPAPGLADPPSAQTPGLAPPAPAPGEFHESQGR